MAEIAVVPSQPVSGVIKLTWETLTEADTCEEYLAGGTEPLICSVQVIGTFGSATVIMQGSNDLVNWVGLSDLQGDAISLTAAGAAEFSTGMLYLRASASGGTGQDLDIFVVMRG